MRSFREAVADAALERELLEGTKPWEGTLSNKLEFLTIPGQLELLWKITKGTVKAPPAAVKWAGKAIEAYKEKKTKPQQALKWLSSPKNRKGEITHGDEKQEESFGTAVNRLDEFRLGAPKMRDDEDMFAMDKGPAHTLGRKLQAMGIDARVEKSGARTQVGMAASALKLGKVVNPFRGAWGVIVPGQHRDTVMRMIQQGGMIESTDAWQHQEPADYVDRVTAKFGPPDEMSADEVRWVDKIPGMTEVTIKDELIAHDYPDQHNDFVHSTREIDVPPEIAAELLKISPTIGVADRLVTVQGRSLLINAITLDFIEDVAMGKVEADREEYEKRVRMKRYPSWYKDGMIE